MGSFAASAAYITACGSSSTDDTSNGSPDATAADGAAGTKADSGTTTAAGDGDASDLDATLPRDDAGGETDGSTSNDSDGAADDDGSAESDADSGSKDGGGDASGGRDAGFDAGYDAGIDAGATANVHFYGRFDTSTAGGPSFDWSGASMLASFTGTGVAVSLNSIETGVTNPSGTGAPDPNEMEVVIDGNPAANNAALTLTAGTHTYQLATALAAGTTHTVQLYKRTEAEYGSVQFLGFQADTGDTAWAAKATTDPYTRHIEVIGDSITCGYGTLSTSQTCAGTTYNNEEDEYLAYGAVAARSLDAGLSVVAYSGKGVANNLDGPPSANDPSIPQLYPQTLESEPASMYNFALQVDAVVINLGTNDYTYQHDQGGTNVGTSFETTYESFLATIRTHYPSAYILLLAGPMITENNPYSGALDDYEAHLTNIVNERKGAPNNDTQIAWVAVGSQDCSTETCGCDDHPNVTRQATIAGVVVNALKAAKGWQ